MHIILGIGNPGPEYARTRHNIGWMVLDSLAERAALQWSKSKWSAMVATWTVPGLGQVLLVKPSTYVNRSGQAAQACCAFYKVPPSQMLVISDDIHLPLATLRLRSQGSHGGHNGLRDIIAHLGQEFPRLRFGVGAPGSDDAQIEHVLGPFSSDEQDDMQAGIHKACACAESWLREGCTAASRFNGPIRPPPPRPAVVARPKPADDPPGEPG